MGHTTTKDRTTQTYETIPTETRFAFSLNTEANPHNGTVPPSNASVVGGGFTRADPRPQIMQPSLRPLS